MICLCAAKGWSGNVIIAAAGKVNGQGGDRTKGDTLEILFLIESFELVRDGY